jgi:hypothetical protein
VWAGLVELDEGLRHEFLQNARYLLAVPTARSNPHEIRVATAISALREASELLDSADRLSVENYKRFRDAECERDWPAPATLCRWLGCGAWNDALRRAHLEIAWDGDAFLVDRGPQYSEAEALEAIRDCRRDVGDDSLSLSTYMAWVRRPDVARRAGRRPRSQGPFDSLFGGWVQARATALGEAALETVGAVRAGSLRPPSGYCYSHEAIVAGLREVAERAEGSPRTGEYQHIRMLIHKEERAKGLPLRVLPSYAVIQQRLGTWDAALAAAGLTPFGDPTLEPREVRTGARHRISNDDILGCIRAAFEEKGSPFTVDAYTAWRKSQLKLSRRQRSVLVIPAHVTIWKRLDTWAAACDAAGVPRHNRPDGKHHRTRRPKRPRY